MDVQTVWVAARALGVAASLLVHPSTPQQASAGKTATALATEIGAEHWSQVPYDMSMDQVFAALGR